MCSVYISIKEVNDIIKTIKEILYPLNIKSNRTILIVKNCILDAEKQMQFVKELLEKEESTIDYFISIDSEGKTEQEKTHIKNLIVYYKDTFETNSRYHKKQLSELDVLKADLKKTNMPLTPPFGVSTVSGSFSSFASSTNPFSSFVPVSNVSFSHSFESFPSFASSNVSGSFSSPNLPKTYFA
jgi:hypothetical protein